MTKEELFKKNFPQYVTEKGKFLSPFWDLFSAGYEAGKDEAEADLATVAYMQGAERYKKELAKRAEQIEALNKDKDYFSDALDKQIEATYKVVEKLNKAKEIIRALLNIFVYDLPNDELDSVDIVYMERAEKFLKEQ